MPDFCSNMTRTVVIRSTIVMLGLIASICHAADSYVFNFANGAKLQFSSGISSKEKAHFGDGWEKAEYISSNGEKFELFPMESFSYSHDEGTNGVIFGNTNSSPPDISPDGKYVMLDIIRVGTVDPLRKHQKVQSKEYCPVMEVRSGCIVTDLHEICGGDWAEQGHKWIGTFDGNNIDATAVGPDEAMQVWKEYKKSQSNGYNSSIHEVISNYSEGVTDIIACSPPDSNNISAYEHIANELKKSKDTEGYRLIIDTIKQAKTLKNDSSK